MADHFYDTSAAVKHYRAELGTAKVDALLADAASRHFLSTPVPSVGQAPFFGARAGIHEPRSRGSSTSRSASPSMLKPNTASEMATPGHTAIHGARNM